MNGRVAPNEAVEFTTLLGVFTSSAFRELAMEHTAAGRLGLSLLLAFLPSLLLLSGYSARAASRPLFAFPAAEATSHQRLRIALNATARRVGQALAALTVHVPTSTFSADSSPLAAAARDDCTELLEESLELLAGAGGPGAASDDALTWLSGALTNHDTCADSLEEAGIVDAESVAHIAAARGMVRDCLAMYAATAAETATARTKDDLAGNPVRNCGKSKKQGTSGFPGWLSGRDRRLLLGPAASLVESADMVVAKDGSGTHATISDAVKAAPECSVRRTVIHVKAGRYNENVKVGLKKTNLLFVGDGKGVTVVAAGRAAADKYTTFHTATFGMCRSHFVEQHYQVLHAVKKFLIIAILKNTILIFIYIYTFL